MTLAQIKEAIFGDSNYKMSFNNQLDINNNPTGWKQYFYTELRIMIVVHTDTFNEITESIKAGQVLTSLGVQESDEVSKETKKPYKKFILVKYSEAEFSL